MKRLGARSGRRFFHPRFNSEPHTNARERDIHVRRLVARELMDDDEAVGSLAEWHHSFRDLERVNRFLGGWSALRHAVARLPAPPRRICDVATGAADLPLRLLPHLEAQGIRATCVCVDRSRQILEIAKQRIASQPEALRERIVVMQADARRLPLAARSFDLAMLNLSLHHFDPPEAVKVLRELARVGRTVIVNDLRRSRIAWAFARLAFPLLTSSRLTQNDGPVSVLRAYTPAELEALAQLAGWQRISVRMHAAYRMTLVGGL